MGRTTRRFEVILGRVRIRRMAWHNGVVVSWRTGQAACLPGAARLWMGQLAARVVSARLLRLAAAAPLAVCG